MHVVRPLALNASGLFSIFSSICFSILHYLSHFILLLYTIFDIRAICGLKNSSSCNEVELRIAIVAIIAAAVVAAITQLASSCIFVLGFRANERPGHFPSGKVLPISVVARDMPDLLVCVNVNVSRNGLAPVPLPSEFF